MSRNHLRLAFFVGFSVLISGCGGSGGTANSNAAVKQKIEKGLNSDDPSTIGEAADKAAEVYGGKK